MRNKRLTFLFSLMALISVLTFSGCGGKQPNLVKVSGVLSFQGKPLDEVQIEFFPDPEKGNAAQSSKAETDSQGKFSLAYTGGANKLGVASGWGRVVLQDFKAMNSRENPIAPRFGPKFTNAFETPIRLEINSENQDLKIDLSNYLK